MTKILPTIALILLFSVLFSGIGWAAQGEMDDDLWEPEETNIVRGKIVDLAEIEDIEDDWFFVGRQIVTVEITSGRFKGQVSEIENLLTGIEYRDLDLRAGEEILLFLELDGSNLVSVNIYDVVRDRYIYILLAVFIVMVLLVGRVKGLKSLLTLAFMGYVVVKWLLPLIMQGYNPMLLAVLFASLITLVTLGIVGGINSKTLAAIIGTIGGLLAAGVFAWAFGSAARLTGFSTEEAQMLQFAELPVELDIRGMLFAGIIIGALGAVLDVAMSISSSVAEIKIANPILSAKGLFKAGFNVGTDIMGTMINTLILAYTGGAIPLLLLFMAYDMSYTRVINMDLIATEIVRSLAGSFGLLTAVPLTALAASYLMGRPKKDEVMD